jgi:hypothetical protein
MTDLNEIDSMIAEVNAGADRLAAAFAEYEQGREHIKADASRTPEWKEKALAELHENTIGVMETAVAGVWGELVYLDESHRSEGPDLNAAPWRAISAITTGITQEMQAAERAQLAPSEADYYRLKAEAMLTRARDNAPLGGNVAKAFLAMYEAADPATKGAIQQLAGGVVPAREYHSQDWHAVRTKIERDRLAALETEGVKALRAKYGELVAALETAYPLTIRASEVFGRRSFSLPRIPRGIKRRADYDPLTGQMAVLYDWQPSQVIVFEDNRISITGGGGLFG